MKTELRRGKTLDDIFNRYKRGGITERRWFFRFAEFGNYVLGFGGTTQKAENMVSFAGAFIASNWLIAVEKTHVEKMDNECCPDYVAELVINKFLSLHNGEIAVSVIYDHSLLYFDADEETHESIIKKARKVLKNDNIGV